MRHLFKILSMFLFVSLPAAAEFWRFDAAVGSWNSAARGTITETFNETLLLRDNIGSHKDKTAPYLYIVVRHPLPILPNLRLEYVDLKSSGTSVDVESLSTTFPFDTINTTVTGVESELLLQQYDAILFYNLLDRAFWLTLDLGADLKYVISRYTVDAAGYKEIELDEGSGSLIPMLYVRGRADLPLKGLGVEADGKFITDGSSTVYDIRLKADYTLDLFALFKPGLELGYRIERIKVVGNQSDIIAPIISGKTESDVTFSGLYGGVTVRF
ncbi:TIGR04219 family outer membrane beta-barrel protein [Sulfurimonas sp. HSL3-7]|uniref:TIGR04219 family outer membrane beta-barrel protein n=1 Tax=Sulfonitrofixus jiaomeiensis TaxID=3131938 RepID=UPI0031F8E3E2